MSAPNFQLRDYQAAAVNGTFEKWAAGIRRLMGILPTGGGKTVVFNAVTARFLDWQPDMRVLVLAHREELLDQGQDKFRRFIGDHVSTGVVMASRDEHQARVVFGSKDTLRNEKRLGRLLSYGKIGLLIIDECHHSVAKSYVGIIDALREANPDLYLLGVTATPNRADGKTYGAIYEDRAFCRTLTDMIPKWLVPMDARAIMTGVSLKHVKRTAGDYNLRELSDAIEHQDAMDIVIETHRDHAHDRAFMAFAVTVEGSKKLCQRFNDAGYRAAHVDGTTPRDDVRRILAQFEAGELDGIVNCAKFTEGFDSPRISAIHMFRPTESDALWMQCIGRGLRPRNGHSPEPGENCLIFDYSAKETRNLTRYGRILDLPEPERKRLAETDAAADTESVKKGSEASRFQFGGGDQAEIDAAGASHERIIVVRELNYLKESPWTWQRSQDWMLLSLGINERDQIKRILAISPPWGGIKTLYALIARPRAGQFDDRGQPAYGPWECHAHRHDADHLALMEYANDLARDRGAASLIDKKKAPRWHKLPATPDQRAGIARMFPDKAADPDLLRGEASDLMTLMIARRVLERAGAWKAAPVAAEVSA